MKLPEITISPERLSFDEALQKEWLITNGLGSYASSTVIGVNARKYHGLLVAALRPPGDHTVCLAKLDEDIYLDHDVFRLGANEFHDNTIYPQGHHFLKEFSTSPFPTYIYKAQNVKVEKTIFLPHKKNAVVVTYKVANQNNTEAKIRIFPLLSCRYFHSIVDKRINPLSFKQQQFDRRIELNFTMPKATIITEVTNGIFVEEPNWVYHLYYRTEALRGETHSDDCYQPGYYEIVVPPKLKRNFTVVTAASQNEVETRNILNSVGVSAENCKQLLTQELETCNRSLTAFYSISERIEANDWLSLICLAIDTFMVHSVNERRSIMAGYYWFGPWGRDTFISLPGLLLVTGRINDARQVLSDFMQYCRDGLIPNFIEDLTGQPVYNTVDGTLWYINAVLQYLKYTGDFDFVRAQLWEKLQSIITFHEKGTAYNIRLDSDGLLAHGSRLTWMDAFVDGEAVTPREGKAVEIQALWYNALKTMQLLATRFEDVKLAKKYATMAEETHRSFNEKFWNYEKGYLFDVLTETDTDPSFRPNQIIATSLDFSVLAEDRSEHIVDVVQQEFLTPYGLRTLARNDPRYRGTYTGNLRSRDFAYHNGTVWPWLFGPFITAYVKVKRGASKFEQAKDFLLPLFTEQVYQAGLGNLSEIHDAEPPYTPKGCVAQAWSVAEPLRAYIEDVLQIRPKYERKCLEYSDLNLCR